MRNESSLPSPTIPTIVPSDVVYTSEFKLYCRCVVQRLNTLSHDKRAVDIHGRYFNTMRRIYARPLLREIDLVRSSAGMCARISSLVTPLPLQIPSLLHGDVYDPVDDKDVEYAEAATNGDGCARESVGACDPDDGVGVNVRSGSGEDGGAQKDGSPPDEDGVDDAGADDATANNGMHAHGEAGTRRERLI